MAKPIDRQEPLIQDTLARIDQLGESDRKVEREAGVPQGFLGKSRKGRNRDETAAPSWAKLRVWLANRGAVGRGIDFDPESMSVGAASNEGPSLPGMPTRESLVSEILNIGTSAKSLRQAHQTLAIATILGVFGKDHSRAELAHAILKSMRDAIKLEKFEQATEKLGELEIMTQDEVDDFRAWQASRAPRGLDPGEASKPPERKP